MASCVGLVPARAGSKRLAHKNIRPLLDHPVIAYTIAAALQRDVFEEVVVSTDSESYADIARHYGAEVPFLRPGEFAGVRMKRSRVEGSPTFEKDLVSQAEVRRRIERWAAVLQP